MATYDISRVAFNPLKHYTSVRMQQGRVLTDDDWNENERIDKEIVRHTNVDIIGRAGSPDDGFKIDHLVTAGGFIDFDILDGTMYLGGIRLDMDNFKITGTAETFRLQKDWLQKRDMDYPVPVPADFANNISEIFNLVYLEAWQQPICAVEDGSLFEPALGGSDTTTRDRYIRRVKLFKNPDSDECALAWCALKKSWNDQHLGKVNKECELIPDTNLKVSFLSTGDKDDLCSPAVTGGYLGAENQAIRVQVTQFDHNTGTGSFTWGFDNAAPLYRIQVAADQISVKMITEPKDQYHWPLSGQVVELLPWSGVLPNSEKIAEQTGFFSKVALSYNPDDPNNRFFTLNTALPAGFGSEWKNRADKNDLSKPSEFFYLRVWNRGTDLQSNEQITFTPGTPVTLGNTGLQVTFTGNDFTAPDGTGNFWVLAARPSTPQMIVPWEITTTGISPNGTRFFYTPLAVIRWTLVNGQVEGELSDCRWHFHPLTEQECCCTFSVGDGVSSKGDFNSIQDAIESLPAEGGKICILSGIHEATVDIFQLRKIHISGCGEQSIVRTPVNANAPIFTVRHSQKIRIDNLTLIALDGIAIRVADDQQGQSPSTEITIRENRILALIHAVRAELAQNRGEGNNIKITFNQIGMIDKENGDVAIFSIADDVLIERNHIVMIAAVRNPDDPNPNPPPNDPTDPCVKLKDLYGRNKRFRLMVNLLFRYVGAYVYGGAAKKYNAPGGIQIGSGSDKVWILQNEIIGGRGNGITLGHIEQLQIENNQYLIAYIPSLYDIIIEENLVVEMGLCGIGTVLHMMQQANAAIVYCDQLLICENTILFCVQDISAAEIIRGKKLVGDDELPVAPISLAFVEDCTIRENRIEDNGRNQLHAICGVFIFFAEKAELYSNLIINNGPDVQESSSLNIRVRGGIVIWFATRLPRRKTAYPDNGGLNKKAFININVPTSPDAIPAIKIQDNIVSQPIGHALFIIAYGPVSVVSNQLTSQGINKREFFSLLAGTVFIFNLGISKDFLNVLYMPLKNWGFVNPSALAAAAASRNDNANRFVTELQNLPNGRTMFCANQIMLDMRSPENDTCISSQMIFSMDDIAFESNQTECAGYTAFLPDQQAGYTADIVFFHTFLFSVSARCNDNRFTDGFSLTLYSLLSFAWVNTAVGNQATHCLIVPFWAYRRKALNIELNVLSCFDEKLEDRLNRNNQFTTDQRFNYVSF